jgi:hypothetical protein
MTIIKSEDMSNEEYHAHHAFGSTSIKTAANKSIAHLFGAERKDSPAFALGSAVHAYLLEPEKDLVVRGPETRRGKAWSDLKDECDAAGKILLTEADYDLANRMADACLKTAWQIICSQILTCWPRLHSSPLSQTLTLT